MVCPRCGTQLIYGSRVCMACGQNVAYLTNPAGSTPKQPVQAAQPAPAPAQQPQQTQQPVQNNFNSQAGNGFNQAPAYQQPMQFAGQGYPTYQQPMQGGYANGQMPQQGFDNQMMNQQMQQPMYNQQYMAQPQMPQQGFDNQMMNQQMQQPMYNQQYMAQPQMTPQQGFDNQMVVQPQMAAQPASYTAPVTEETVAAQPAQPEAPKEPMSFLQMSQSFMQQHATNPFLRNEGEQDNQAAAPAMNQMPAQTEQVANQMPAQAPVQPMEAQPVANPVMQNAVPVEQPVAPAPAAPVENVQPEAPVEVAPATSEQPAEQEVVEIPNARTVDEIQELARQKTGYVDKFIKKYANYWGALANKLFDEESYEFVFGGVLNLDGDDDRIAGCGITQKRIIVTTTQGTVSYPYDRTKSVSSSKSLIGATINIEIPRSKVKISVDKPYLDNIFKAVDGAIKKYHI